MAEVVLKDVNKIFPGGVKAVVDFNLRIPDGEFMVLVGPSGCGKSTTLRMVAGLEEISSGTIEIGGRVVNDIPPKDRDIAMVFQNYALYPHMTVRENMAFGLKLRKLPKKEIDTRIQEAARILGLSELLERQPKALSGGQRQRVAVGRAIVRKPAVFLFDEPLSNLDAKLRVQMRVEISRLHTQLGTTMIYVTHDQVEAMTLGGRIVVMKDGISRQTAEPLMLYDYPADRFVAGFIGTPPMNFFEGRISQTGGGLVFAASEGFTLPVPAALKSALAAYKDQPVVAGIRPEDIGSHAAEMAPEYPRIRARVEVIEPMGSESYVYYRVGSTMFVSRIEAHKRVKLGEDQDPGILIEKMHFFDPKTEVRIQAV